MAHLASRDESHSDSWRIDSRIGAEFQLTNDYYRENSWDRGHLARRASAARRPDQRQAQQSADETFSGSHDYAGDGTFPVTIVVIDDDGGFGVDTFTVKVGSGIPKLPVPILSATQWALIMLAVGFGVLLIRRRLGTSSRAPG